MKAILDFINSVLGLLGLKWSDLLRVFITAGVTYGLVLILGRLIGLLKTVKQKNITAAILLFFISWCITYVKFPRDRIRDAAWDILCYGAFAGIIYIGLFWKLVDRFDTWLDRKGLKDKKKYRG